MGSGRLFFGGWLVEGFFRLALAGLVLPAFILGIAVLVNQIFNVVLLWLFEARVVFRFVMVNRYLDGALIELLELKGLIAIVIEPFRHSCLSCVVISELLLLLFNNLLCVVHISGDENLVCVVAVVSVVGAVGAVGAVGDRWFIDWLLIDGLVAFFVGAGLVKEALRSVIWENYALVCIRWFDRLL